MKKKTFERHLSTVLKKELASFPKPSQNLQGRLVEASPQRIKKYFWAAALGFASTAIILFFICVGQDSRPVSEIDAYFKPTKIIDLNDDSFEPTKVIKIEE